MHTVNRIGCTINVYLTLFLHKFLSNVAIFTTYPTTNPECRIVRRSAAAILVGTWKSSCLQLYEIGLSIMKLRYQQWPSYNLFCCCGRCIFGRDWPSSWGMYAMVLVGTGIFCFAMYAMWFLAFNFVGIDFLGCCWLSALRVVWWCFGFCFVQ